MRHHLKQACTLGCVLAVLLAAQAVGTSTANVGALCASDGDVSNDGSLTPGDALCAFNIFLGGGVLPPGCDVAAWECEIAAADVNCDGTVTPGDALEIFSRYLSAGAPEHCFAEAYRDLKEKDDVLANLELAYNRRNADEVERLLDPGFVFFFSVLDFQQGHTPEMWDRVSELLATGNMFDPTYVPPGKDPISDINVTLTYPPCCWIQIEPPQAPGEMWYQRNVGYFLTVQAGDITYRSLDVTMTVTVRFAEVEGDSIWQMVEWMDDTGPDVTGGGSGPMSSEEFTWGRVKAIYGGP